MKIYNFIKYVMVVISMTTMAPFMIILATPEVAMDGVDKGIYYTCIISSAIGGGLSVFGDLILEMMGVEGVDPL